MTAQHETQKLSHSQQLTKVKCYEMRGKSVSQLQSALPPCWDNPFLIISSAHHHSTSQTWSQQHRSYWLYLIFLIFNYQTPHKVYDVCTESWQIPGHTFHHHSPGRHYWSLSAPPASLSTVCTVSRKSQVTPRHSRHHLRPGLILLCVVRENAVCGWSGLRSGEISPIGLTVAALCSQCDLMGGENSWWWLAGTAC